MVLFFKATGGILIALVLWMTLQKQEKDLALVLSLVVCVLGSGVLLSMLEPVMEQLRQLGEMGQLEQEVMEVLMKTLGIGLTAQIFSALCRDAGNSAMGNLLSLLGSGTILYLSLPLVRAVLSLVQEILGLI